jgi:translation elongation factor EF-1alpha
MEAIVSILGVYRITGLGIVVEGKIMTVKSVEKNHEEIAEAHEGDTVGIILQNGDYNLLKSQEKIILSNNV